MSLRREILVTAADNLAQAIIGVPIDLRPYALVAYAATFQLPANAPTLYFYDGNGHMRPSPGHSVSPEEQAFYDEVNRKYDVLMRDRSEALDSFLGKTLRFYKIEEPFMPAPYPKEELACLSPTVISNPDPLVKDIRYVMVDPLVLDLDGDGLEITPLSQGVQFDGNGDTIRTNTSWIDADDGLLALDRNGNGVIDSGRELFGDETLLSNGTKAAHGFAALAELDVGGAANATGGAGDGVFDAKDAQYTNVRIWRDLNQDGISQAGEMQTLAQAGIASIKLDSTKTSTRYGDAQLVQSGSFTRTDGSEGQAGSFILAQNNAVTTHAPIAISTQEEEATAVLMAMGAAFTALPGHQRCRHKAQEQRNLESGPRGRTWLSSWRRSPSSGTAR